jgi:proline racemase
MMFRTIEAHAEAEPSRVLLDSERWVHGSTMEERYAYCRENLDWLRLLLLHEPRGYPALCSVLVMPPTRPDADIALVVMEPAGFTPMSGSNTICTITALLETGVLPMSDQPSMSITVETAVGLVRAEATLSDGKVERVTIHNVPAYVVELDRVLDVPSRGEVVVDVAFGGQFFVLADATALGIDLTSANTKALIEAGTQIKRASLEQIDVRHPLHREIDAVGLVMLCGTSDTAGVDAKNTVVMSNGALTDDPSTWAGVLDRSPCGTGTCARMAVMHARGELGIGEPFVHQGILGTTFVGELEAVTTVGDHAAVQPIISGRAWVTGRSEWQLDPSDPFPMGYTLGDIWSPTS